MIGHSKDVLSVAFSPDNRQIASGSIDKNLKIWNIHGVCKFTVDQNQHTDWVSQVRYFHDVKNPIIVSASWDRTIKVWDNSSMSLKHIFHGHKAQINSLDLAPNTNFIASGGRDGKVNIWNLVDGKHLEEIPAPPSKYAPVPQWLEELIQQLLAKTPEERPQLAEEVVAWLEKWSPEAEADIRAFEDETGKQVPADSPRPGAPAKGASPPPAPSAEPRLPWIPTAAIVVLRLLGLGLGVVLLFLAQQP